MGIGYACYASSGGRRLREIATYLTPLHDRRGVGGEVAYRRARISNRKTANSAVMSRSTSKLSRFLSEA